MDGGANGYFFPGYGGAGGAAVNDTLSSRIMLRFRPIAPKPASDGSSSAGMMPKMTKDLSARGRTKRKYVRIKRTRRCRESKADDDDNTSNINGAIVTLQLLPETNSPAQNMDVTAINPGEEHQLPSRVINSDMSGNRNKVSVGVLDRPDRKVVESVVTMECLTDTYAEGGGLGRTDMERMRNLERDTCPAFVSDVVDRVQWVNLAYRKMVDPQDGGKAPPSEVAVCLVVKERLPVEWPAFACRVRVMFTWQKEKMQSHSQTLPCDVWRMDCGGFAWRLDLKAALSLGR